MRKSSYLTLPVAALLALSPVRPAAALDGDTLLKAIVGGVITGIVVNELNRDRDRGSDVVSTQNRPLRLEPPADYAPEFPREAPGGAVRDVQRALTFFGFDAGPADGVIGARTEAAVRDYQQWMGYPVTGRLSERGHAALLAAWSEARAGVGSRLYAGSMGPRALLEPARVEALATVTDPRSETRPAPPPQENGPAYNLPAPPRELGPAPDPGPDTGPADGGVEITTLPAPGEEPGSLAGFCAHPSVAGLNVTLASMEDPRDALDQSFCEARAAAIAQSDALAREVANVSARQIAGQCAQLGPVMEPHVTSLATRPRGEVVAAVRDFAEASGTERAALARTARICLGTGYDDEQLKVALGAALLLVALDEPAYGELMGHHLYHGFGVARSEPKALDWWLWSTDEVAAGADPGFGRDSRAAELVDAAVYRLSRGPLR
jgi:peptidoglycan hydrolase-like protein with peptidoglycan-binding domain